MPAATLSKIPLATLPSGATLQSIGYGTGTVWIKESEDDIDRKVVDAIKGALELGYRHLDCAQYYQTEREVGVAIKESGVPRAELFITTKAVSPHDTEGALRTSLNKLQTDYVDLYLLHEPFSSGGNDETLQNAWLGAERCLEQGIARSIGVSHFSPKHFETIAKVAKVKPAVNQLEVHPYLQRTKLRAYLDKEGIAIQAFGSLAPLTSSTNGPVDATMQRIAEKYNTEPAIVLLRWILDQGMVAITTSGKRERLEGYLNKTWDFKLEQSEIQEISEEGSKRNFRGFFCDGYGDSWE